MKLELYKEISNPIIIEGFPGFGLVSTIAVEYLIHHLKTEQIGRVISDKLPPMVAVHEGRIVEPIGVFYNPDFNLIFIYSMLNPKGVEWEISEVIMELAKRTNAREIISMEGIGKTTESGDKRFMFCTHDETRNKLSAIGIEPLSEGIILGVTSTILANVKNCPVSCVFVEADQDIPDSKGAAKLIETLDKIIGFNIDTQPLVETAKIFEGKIKKIIESTKNVTKQESDMNYVG